MNSNISTNANISRSITINAVLKNTYQLLSITLLFSGLMAYLSMALQLPQFNIFIVLGGYFGLLFLTSKFRNSSLGLLCVFALTGFMGLTLGPIVNAYTHAFSNGAELVAMAMTGTAVIFLSLSFYAITSGRDFSFMSGFLTAGIIVAFLAGLGAYFFAIPALSLTVSAAFILLMSGLILFETSHIIHGGETNYIIATVTLFVSIYNLFLSLLQLLGFFSGDD